MMLVQPKRLKIKFSKGGINTDPPGISCGDGINDYMRSNTSVAVGNKRVSTWMVGCPKEKKQKTETSALAMCSSILEDLMSHEFGWIFNQPVDPVALNILDYLTIITKPMDLGTIKSKLDKNDYYGVAEFAADVRLTFSNAMHYNPPMNDVHAMAKTLSCIFEKKYKVLQNRFGSDTLLKDTMQKCDAPALLVNRSAPKRSLPLKGKVVRCSSEARAADIVEHSKTNTYSMQKLGKNFIEGTDNSSRRPCVSINAKKPSSVTLKQCSSRSGTESSSRRTTVSANAKKPSSITVKQCSSGSCSEISSDRSLGKNHPCSATSRIDRRPRPDPESERDNISSSREESTPTVKLSLQEALRAAKAVAAKLKSHYAETTLKVEDKRCIDPFKAIQGNKITNLEKKHNKKSGQRQPEIEEEVMTEVVSRTKTELGLKHQREREREAARVALDKVVEEADIDQTLEYFEALERLCGYKPSCRFTRRGNHCYIESSGLSLSRSPLEKLGLFLKEEYMDGEEDD
ncbi:transcription factor GTE9 isoform X1 [Cannabis sativa]|uniref:transcription factor GTE9 isoform X1 n=1 Tax=Cannabis sativa TaxID=3483 RepID=UPI0029CA0294|nr:transcription factor GTE9 isoform X1 [Cannabis sativa]XP_030484820.2 transcription factor GTE9 isoform X1 [Cannabis sativa]